MYHSIFQMSFQLLIVILNVLSSDFQTLGDVVQPGISYAYLQGSSQVVGSDFLVVFFLRYLAFKSTRSPNALCSCVFHSWTPIGAYRTVAPSPKLAMFILYSILVLLLYYLRKKLKYYVAPWISSSGQGTGIAPRNDQCIFGVVMLEIKDERLFSWHENL